MPVREFLRGGYKDANDMIVVTNHGRPVGTWIPTDVPRIREVKAQPIIVSFDVPKNSSR